MKFNFKKHAHIENPDNQVYTRRCHTTHAKDCDNMTISFRTKKQSKAKQTPPPPPNNNNYNKTVIHLTLGLTIVMVASQFHNEALDVVRDTTFVAFKDEALYLLAPVSLLLHAACLLAEKETILLALP